MIPRVRAGYRVAAALCVAAWGAWAVDVRIQARNGVPQIHVGGKPVRGRMFFGIPGVSEQPVGPGATRVEFSFKAIESEPSRATMHIRFGHAAGTVVLDTIRVLEDGTGREVIPPLDFEEGIDAFSANWRVWPVGDANTVGSFAVEPGVGEGGSAGLRVRIQEPPGAEWPDFHLYHDPVLRLDKGKRYRVSMWVRSDKPRGLRIEFYRPGETFVRLGMPPGVFESQVALAAEVGVDFVSFPVPLPWPPPDAEPDYSNVDAVCDRILEINPRALLLPRIPMEPPTWWKAAHPDAVMVWEDGPKGRGFSPASEAYRRDAAARLGALVRHLEERFGDRMAGYHPSGHNTGEWFYEDTWERKFDGYSEANLRGWRAWLERTYADDEALRRAWGRDDVARATAVVPTPAERRAHPGGILRDPVAERHIADFNRYRQETMADCVLALAKAVREATEGRKLVVFFYGYVHEFGAILNGPSMSGHYALRRVLESPDVDVLCSPISYFDRGAGQSAPCMTAAESVHLAGKLWLNEDDTATYLSSGTFPGHTERVDTFEGTAGELLRNVGQEAARNFATWWMDLGGTGWFNDAKLWGEMRRLEAIDLPLLADPVPYTPPVALVVHEGSTDWVAEGGHVVTRPLIYESRGALARTGIPFGQYLADDMAAGAVDANLAVMLNAWSLTSGERDRLRGALRGKGRVWCYAPGYIEDGRAGEASMRALTGLDLRRMPPGVAAKAVPTAAGQAAGIGTEAVIEQPVAPLFTVAGAPGDNVWATYPDGQPAVVLQRTPDGGFDLFVGVPRLHPDLIRAAAREAGIASLSDDECVLYANGGFVTVHATRDGTVRLRTGPGTVRDALTGEDLGPGPHTDLPMRKGETRILRLP